MKHILFLAFRYLRFNKAKTVILIFSVAVAVFLPLAVNLLVDNYQRDLLARAVATPLVAGAPGSRLDLVLNALYFRGKPAHDLSLAEVATLQTGRLAQAIPILGKYTARGAPVVGTSLEYFAFRGLSLENGQGLTRLGDCVLGATAAKKFGLKPGDSLMSDPENVFDLAGSYPLRMRVRGILAPAGTADDNAVFVDVKTVWLIMGLFHGHQDATKADPSLLLERDANNVTASAALLSYQEVTGENITSFHLHGEAVDFPVSAVIAVPKDAKSSAILRGRYQDPKATVQLLVPKDIVAETLELVFRVKRFFDAQALLVGVATVLLLSLVMLLSLRLRRGEMATMFKIGCARGMIFWLQATEILIVVLAGTAIAGGLAWWVLKEFGTAGSATTTAHHQPVAGGKKHVAVVNYPLDYFTHRLAGERITRIFPITPDQDPAFWQPTDPEIVQYQQADLILLNGAEYEKWLSTTTLPMETQIVTSQEFADHFLKNDETVTHSHGPGGDHSHGRLDFNIWLDPQQATQQARAAHDALVRLLPEAAAELDQNLAALQHDLEALDANLAAIPLKQPLFGSHPVYQYLARRYEWNLRSLHWEPDEMPSEEEWNILAELHQKHPAKIMIWEAAPLPAVAERLRKMGIEPVLFETCSTAPAVGDYLSAMQANADRLRKALAPSE